MFPGSYYPSSYWPPNYFPHMGGGVSIGAGATAFLLSQRVLMHQAVAEDYHRQEQVYQRYRAARDAAAQMSFQLAMVQLRNYEEEARRQMLLQRAMVATFLAEV